MLTDTQIQKAIKAKRTVDLSEGSGSGTGRLVLRLNEGRAHWYVRWFEGDKKRFLRIGRYPTTTLQEARNYYNNQFSPDLQKGKRPVRVKATTGTVMDLVKAYTDQLHERGKDENGEATKCLTRFAVYVGESTRANMVSKDDVISFLRSIHSRGSVYMADYMRRYISACFNWAIKAQSDYRSTCAHTFNIEINPADKIPAEGRRLSDRFLNVEELRSFWHWLNLEKRNTGNRELRPESRVTILLQIVTGQRFIEIARLRPEMIDWNEGTIYWGKTKVQNKPHLLPLPAVALDLLRSVEPNQHGWYFPSLEDPKKHLMNKTASYLVKRYLEQSKAKKFLCRDLRRTWKTLAGEAGITKADRDLLQNHHKQDVSSIHYDRYTYLREKRQAMKVWEDWFRSQIQNPFD